MSQVGLLQQLPVLENVLCSGLSSKEYDMTASGGQKGVSYKATLTVGENAVAIKLSEDAFEVMNKYWQNRPGGLPPVFSLQWTLAYNNELRVTSVKFVGFLGQIQTSNPNPPSKAA